MNSSPTERIRPARQAVSIETTVIPFDLPASDFPVPPAWRFRQGPRVAFPEFASCRLTVAHHEAGHAVLFNLLRVPIRSVHVREPGGGGVVRFDFDSIKASAAKTDALKDSPQSRSVMKTAAIELAAAYLAGVMAELRYHGRLVAGCVDADSLDFQNARRLLREEFGDSAGLFHCQRLAALLLDRHWSWVTNVARSLYVREQISGACVSRLRPGHANR